MPQEINFKEIDFIGLKNSLIEFLQGTDSFKDANFDGTFMNELVHMLAYTGAVMGTYVNAMGSEQYIKTCNLYETANMLASLVGYRSPGFESAKTSVTIIPDFDAMGVIEDDTNTILGWVAAIPRNSTFTTSGSSRGGKGVVYSNIQDRMLVAKVDTNDPNINNVTLELIQGIPLSIEFMSSGEPLQTFEIPNFQIDWDNIKVYVQGESDKEELWEPVRTWFYNTANDKIYVKYINPKGLTEVLFAEGNFGEIPPKGRRIRIEYYATQGAAGTTDVGQVTSLTSNIKFVNPDSMQTIDAVFKVVHPEASTEGSDMTPMNYIKKFAPLMYGVQERLVNDFDYKYYILNGYKFLSDVQAFNYNDAVTAGLIRSQYENELANARFQMTKSYTNIEGELITLPEIWNITGFHRAFTVFRGDDNVVTMSIPEDNIIVDDILNTNTNTALFVDTTAVCETEQCPYLVQNAEIIFPQENCNVIRFDVEVLNPIKVNGHYGSLDEDDIMLFVNGERIQTRIKQFLYSTDGYSSEAGACVRYGDVDRRIEGNKEYSAWMTVSGVYYVDDEIIDRETLLGKLDFQVYIKPNRFFFIGEVNAFPLSCQDANDVFIVIVPNNAGYLNIATRNEILNDIDRIDMLNVRNHILAPIYQTFDVKVIFKRDETSLITLDNLINEIKTRIADYFSPFNQQLGAKINTHDIADILKEINGVLRARVILEPKNENMKNRVNEYGDYQLTEAEFPILGSVTL